MKVHITSTPEFSVEKLDEIVSLLSSIPGELKFHKGKLLTEKQYKRLNPRLEDINGIDSLTFDEYYDLVQGYRDLLDIPDADFIVLISTIRHNDNWFSAFDKRNIFVRGDEWDIISDVDSKFGIAYQCVENIFQSLIDLDIINYENEPNIHIEPIGCINDFCGYKPDILKKLKSADICDSCYNRYKQTGTGDVILAHIVSIIDEIRKEFVISKKFTKELILDKVRVDNSGNIFIGDRFIKLEPLPRVVYISFLKNLDGIQSNQLCENKNLFEKTYQKIKDDDEPNPEAIRNLCCKRIDKNSTQLSLKPTFETYRSKLKAALVKTLGQTLTNYYHINYVEDQNHQMIFKILLSKDQLDLDTTFTK